MDLFVIVDLKDFNTVKIHVFEVEGVYTKISNYQNCFGVKMDFISE